MSEKKVLHNRNINIKDKMTNISDRFFEVFKNKFKSDAMPRAPRPLVEDVEDVTHQESPENAYADSENNENVDSSNTKEPEISPPTSEEDLKNPKSKSKPKEKSNPKVQNKPKSGSTANGPAPVYTIQNIVNNEGCSGVVNIVGVSEFQLGNVYNFGQMTMAPPGAPQPPAEPTGVKLKKCPLVKSLMTATIKPDHEYIDYLSKNMSKYWESTFRKMKYKQGKIDTFIIEAGPLGISEARYKLLLDWVRNTKNNSLGHLATALWEADEREVVKGLAEIYNNNKYY